MLPRQQERDGVERLNPKKAPSENQMGTVGIDGKIRSLDELATIIQGLKSEGRTVVQCHGVFDLLHPCHIRHFQAARREGDVLVTTVTQDEHVGKGPGRPVFDQRLRAESIAALEYVDYVAINQWPDAANTIRLLKPNVYVKGSDYRDPEQDLTGKISAEEEAVRSVGGQIRFTDEIRFSSTSLINTHFDVFPDDAVTFLEYFRGNWTSGDVIADLKKLAKLKILVIGDTIVDEYHYCRAMGKSLKENVITTKYIGEDTMAGGVLAVANHLAGFCEQVDLVTCLGSQDSREDFVRSHLKPNVRPRFVYRDDAPTTVKRRFVDVDYFSKMFEICFMDDANLPGPAEAEVCSHVGEAAEEYDLVLAADFGHGTIGPRLVETVTERSKFLAVMTQTNSANTGFNLITKYPRADYVCVNGPELRLASGDKFGGLEQIAEGLCGRLGCQSMVVTLGNQGLMVVTPGAEPFHIPVFSKEVVDRVGAGDSVFAMTSACVAAGLPTELVGFIGNAVGALAVRIVGNKTSVEPASLYKYVTTLLS